MSTLTIVQKDGIAALAADQMTTRGSCKCPAEHKSFPSKIVRVGESWIGAAGSVAHIRVLRSLARYHADQFDLCSVDSIFETFRRLHRLLINDYYLLTKEDDDEQPYQSSHLSLLIANSTGIYEVEGYREVTQYERFWATGSGYDFAVGAMAALYDERDLSAREIAQRGVESGCRFDRGSGPPVEAYVVPLR